MKDTPKDILHKQFEIINAKPLKVRLATIFELTELSRKIQINRIKAKKPDISDIDLKVELFKVFYRFDFDQETLAKIADRMRLYLKSAEDQGG